MRGFQLDPQRRANQIEFLAESPFEEALVGLRHMLERIAVYDDDRRVHAALVRIAHLGAVDARLLGRLELYGLHQQAREHRRGHLAGGSLVRLEDRVGKECRSRWSPYHLKKKE